MAPPMPGGAIIVSPVPRARRARGRLLITGQQDEPVIMI
jgi:hypothetical protein